MSEDNILKNITEKYREARSDEYSLEESCFYFEDKYDLDDYSIKLNKVEYGFLVVNIIPHGTGKVIEWLDKFHEDFIRVFDLKLTRVEVKSVLYETRCVDRFELHYTYKSNYRVNELSVDSLRDTLERY